MKLRGVTNDQIDPSVSLSVLSVALLLVTFVISHVEYSL